MRKNKKVYLILFALLMLVSCGNRQSELPDLSSLGNITVVMREEGSGTRSEFGTLAGTGQKASGRVVLSTNDVLDAVAKDRNAIGYVAYSAIDSTEMKNLKLLTIDGIPCDTVTIKNGRYPLKREYILCYSGAPSELEEDFLRYIRTAGQEVIPGFCTPLREASRFLSDRTAGDITITGSSSMETLMAALIASYAEYNPEARITLEVTDSSDGINRAIRGQTDIAMSSRTLKSYESELLEKQGIAADGIAVIVNKENPLADISMKRLRDIYDGTVTAWNKLR